MNRAVDVVAYQAVWFAAVVGAAHGRAWPGPLASLLFFGWHLAIAPRRARILALSAAGVAFGLLIDGSLARAKAIDYAATWPGAFAAVGAPAWILALWAVFPLTLTVSLDALQRRPWLAAAVGALGAPLAYSAARGMGAWSTTLPAAAVLSAVAAGWAVALPVLGRIARGRGDATLATPWSLPR